MAEDGALDAARAKAEELSAKAAALREGDRGDVSLRLG